MKVHKKVICKLVSFMLVWRCVSIIVGGSDVLPTLIGLGFASIWRISFTNMPGEIEWNE